MDVRACVRMNLRSLPWAGRLSLGLLGVILWGAFAQARMPGVWRAYRPLQNDTRVVKDRLQSSRNLIHEDDSFLHAVGAVWSYAISPSTPQGMQLRATGRQRSGSHAGTEDSACCGGGRGARDTTIIDHLVQKPEGDWALIQLSTNVENAITPLTVSAIYAEQLPVRAKLAAAGYPADHRQLRDDGFKLKDLWGSQGEIVNVVWTGTSGAFIETTIQPTPGDSGGPIYGDFNGRQHLVVGMVQSIRGNGIDVSETMPNIQILFTPVTLDRITAAKARTPCG